MRSPERPSPPVLQPETAAAKRLQCRRFERLSIGQGGKNAGEARRKHGFPRARRAAHQQTVPSGCSNFERTLGLTLSFYLGEIGIGVHVIAGGRTCAKSRQPGVAGQMRNDIQQARRRINKGIADQRRFARVQGRQNKCTAAFSSAPSHGKRAADGSQFTGQRQFASKLILLECICGNLPRRGKNSKRNRKIKSSAFLGQLCWGEINGDPSRWKIKAAIGERRAHPLPRFLYLGLG